MDYASLKDLLTDASQLEQKEELIRAVFAQRASKWSTLAQSLLAGAVATFVGYLFGPASEQDPTTTEAVAGYVAVALTVLLFCTSAVCFYKLWNNEKELLNAMRMYHDIEN